MENLFLCDLTHVGQRIASDCFPMGIGCIAAYMEAYSKNPIKVHLIKFPQNLYDMFIKHQPRIIGFSNYIWNFDLSRSYARIIKEKYPKTVIIFGGPNFPIDKEERKEFLIKNNMIDFYIEGEGEKAFLSLVNNLCSYDFDLEKVKSLLNPSVITIFNGKYIENELYPRINDLDKIPSAYLTGNLDKFFGKRLMPLIQTTRGCPFSCTYCVEGNEYYQKVFKRNIKNVEYELEFIAERAIDNKQLFIADSNFGMFKQDIETAKILSKTDEKYGFPYYIQVATGKNQKERILEVARILKGKLRLSGSVQSLDPVVQANIKRENISLNQLLSLAGSAREIGANSYSEVIIGLPGDTLNAFMNTMKGVIEADFNFILPWTLILLEGSYLASQQSKEKYGLIIKYRVMPRCFGIYHFGNKEFISGEIEEVCVGNNTMSIDDYVECRMFTLTTALFYNDRIFEEIIETLKILGLSSFQWLNLIHNSQDKFPEKLKEIYAGFRKYTIEELWDSRDELYTFIKKSENIEKYINGELGINVMYTYRSKTFISCMKELNDYAFNHANLLIQENFPDIFLEYKDYLEELKLFSSARIVDMFDLDKKFEFSFSYDFQKILTNKLYNLKNTENLKGKFNYRFYHRNEQKQAIQEQMSVFGSDITGLAKVLSRIHISKMYRYIEEVNV